MRIKVRHLQAALSVLAEDDRYYSNVKAIADQLDQDIESKEISGDDVLIEVS